MIFSMLIRNRKSEMLEEFNKCEFSDNDPIEQKQGAINRIASEQLSDLSDELKRKHLGEFTDADYEKCLDEITSITNEVLRERLGSLPLSELKELINNAYTKMNNNL